MARQAATAISPLLYRTQGLQLFRDAQWGLCNDMLSGYLSPKEYISEKKERFDKLLPLIEKEVQFMSVAQVAFFTHGGATGPTLTWPDKDKDKDKDKEKQQD